MAPKHFYLVVFTASEEPKPLQKHLHSLSAFELCSGAWIVPWRGMFSVLWAELLELVEEPSTGVLLTPILPGQVPLQIQAWAELRQWCKDQGVPDLYDEDCET